MKKILILVMSLILLGGMVFGADESAQVIITTSVGETTANSGIRVVQPYAGTTITDFDATFFSAGSVVTLATGKDTSKEDASGEFVVMVRRPVNTAVTVAISGTPMALTGGTATIPYKIKGTGIDSTVYVDYISGTVVSSRPYTTGPAVDGILRDAKKFTYTILAATSAPLGTYSATITFEIETE